MLCYDAQVQFFLNVLNHYVFKLTLITQIVKFKQFLTHTSSKAGHHLLNELVKILVPYKNWLSACILASRKRMNWVRRIKIGMCAKYLLFALLIVFARFVNGIKRMQVLKEEGDLVKILCRLVYKPLSTNCLSYYRLTKM